MTKHNSRHSTNSTHSKTCPPHKFSFMSGCMSWLTAVNLLGALSLIIVCILIYMTYNKNALNVTYQPSHKVTSGSDKFQNLNNDTGNGSLGINVSGFDYTRSPNEGTATPQSGRVQYDINLNIRDSNPNVPNLNAVSYAQYQADKDIERIVNPILPPERSYENSYGLPINIPSRGPTGAYQQVGFLSQNSADPNDPNGNLILPLMGRPIYFGSKNWSYYTFSEKYQTVKLPLMHKGRKCDQDLGCPEMYQGDKVHVPPYKGDFTVNLYDYDKPSYIPYVY